GHGGQRPVDQRQRHSREQAAAGDQAHGIAAREDLRELVLAAGVDQVRTGELEYRLGYTFHVAWNPLKKRRPTLTWPSGGHQGEVRSDHGRGVMPRLTSDRLRSYNTRPLIRKGGVVPHEPALRPLALARGFALPGHGPRPG